MTAPSLPVVEGGQTSPENDVAAIAKGLSEPGRNAVLRGKCAVPRTSEEWSSDCICSADGADGLVEIGLAYPRARFPGGIVLSPLGLAVRAHLESSK